MTSLADRPTRDGGLYLAAGGTAIVVTSAIAALAFVNGAARPVLLAVGAVAALALGYLAMTRIAVFALVLLAVRASLDITSMAQSGTPGGTSGVPATAVSLLLIFTVTVWVTAQRWAGLDVLPALSLAGIAVAVSAVLSTVGSIRPVVTLTEAARVTSSIAMLVLLVAVVRTDRDVQRTLRVVYLSMVVPFAVAIWQAITGGTAGFDNVSRIVGTFNHPNAFGAYLAVLLVTGVALTKAVRGTERRVLVALLVVGFVLLVLTYSRGSWLATAIGLVVVAIVQRRPTVLGFLAVVAAGGAMVPSVWTRLSDLGESRSVYGTEGNSLVWRFDFWRETLQFADKNPATGIGLDMMQFVTADGSLPHNDFIRMYVEAGWIGLLALITLLVLLAATAWRARSLARTDFDVAVSSGFAGSFTSIVVVMAGGNVVSSVVLLWYFFAVAASVHYVATGSPPSLGTTTVECRL